MYCPYCQSSQNYVANTRPTKKGSQVWRRRKCESCDEVFTTHEIADLSHLRVKKRSGDNEMFSRTKLISGIREAFVYFKTLQMELVAERIAFSIEKKLLQTHNLVIDSELIADHVLRELIKKDMTAFLRFLVVSREIKSKRDISNAIKKYSS